MMPKSKISVFFAPIVISLLLMGCQTTSKSSSSVPPGTLFQNAIKIGIGSQQIPLPKGTWEVAASDVTLNNQSTHIQSMTLFQRQGSKVSKAIYISTPLDIGNYGYVQAKNCRRDDMHYRKTEIDILGGDQDCAWVNHYRVTLKGSTNKIGAATGTYYEEKGLTYSNHLIQSGYRFADAGTFLTLHYFFDPSMDGFENYPRTAWMDSPWHPQSILGDAKKEIYVNRIKSWTDEWHVKVRAGFRGELASVSNVVASPPSSKLNEESASRLKNLRSLLDQKLIDQVEYDRKRQEILKSL